MLGVFWRIIPNSGLNRILRSIRKEKKLSQDHRKNSILNGGSGEFALSLETIKMIEETIKHLIYWMSTPDCRVDCNLLYVERQGFSAHILFSRYYILQNDTNVGKREYVSIVLNPGMNEVLINGFNADNGPTVRYEYPATHIQYKKLRRKMQQIFGKLESVANPYKVRKNWFTRIYSGSLSKGPILDIPKAPYWKRS